MATTFWRMRSQSMPRPSSPTVITTLLPRCEAWSDTVPARGLPAASRSPGGSSPWSTALRTMWIKGSESSSIIRLSSSVFSPPIWRFTSLPEERLRSRMTRRNRSNSGPIGTIRVSSTPFCKPSETRPRLWIASESALTCSRASRIKYELVLDRAEVIAEPADVGRPAVERRRRTSPRPLDLGQPVEARG